MQRVMAPLPPAYSMMQLEAMTRNRWPMVVAVNSVDDPSWGACLAVYFTDEAKPTSQAVTAWKADVARHVPTATDEREPDPSSVGAKGDPGVKGDPGPPGTPGVPGTDAPQRWHGSGAPTVVVGAAPGDEYVDITTGDLYVLN